MKSIFRFDPHLLARGTEEFWVPAVISALGTGVQAVNQSNANSRAQNAEVQGIEQQQQYRQQANDQVKGLTNQIAKNTPQQIADQEQSKFVNTLRQNEAGSEAPSATGTNDTNFGAPVSALAPAAGASSRYKSDTAAAQKQTQQYGNDYSGQMSAIDSAVRQRQNEGLALNTLGTNLNVLGGESAGTGFVNQLRAQSAGQTSPWASLFSGLLKQGANGMSNNGWFANTPDPNNQNDPNFVGPPR